MRADSWLTLADAGGAPQVSSTDRPSQFSRRRPWPADLGSTQIRNAGNDTRMRRARPSSSSAAEHWERTNERTGWDQMSSLAGAADESDHRGVRLAFPEASPHDGASERARGLPAILRTREEFFFSLFAGQQRGLITSNLWFCGSRPWWVWVVPQNQAASPSPAGQRSRQIRWKLLERVCQTLTSFIVLSPPFPLLHVS